MFIPSENSRLCAGLVHKNHNLKNPSKVPIQGWEAPNHHTCPFLAKYNMRLIQHNQLGIWATDKCQKEKARKEFYWMPQQVQSLECSAFTSVQTKHAV